VQKSLTGGATRNILVALAFAALAILIWRLADVLIVAFGGIVVAAVIHALAEPLKRFRGISHGLRLSIALVAMLVLLGLVGWLFGSQVSSQADELQRLLPQQYHRVMAWVARTQLGRTFLSSFKASASGASAVGGIGTGLATFFRGALDAVLILFLGVYFAFDPELYVGGFLRLLPPIRRPQVRAALLEAGIALKKWLRAQLVAMVLVGILAGVGLAIVGVPLALVLGGLAALLEFIPVVGPIIFAIPAVLVAFSQGPRTAFYALLVFTAIQQLESNVIIPLLQRWAVKMPPVVGLLAVLAAGVLLGPGGIIFAAPIAVVTIELVKLLYVEDTLEK
jgi:predicted PurR-regulated permease PerM